MNMTKIATQHILPSKIQLEYHINEGNLQIDQGHLSHVGSVLELRCFPYCSHEQAVVKTVELPMM